MAAQHAGEAVPVLGLGLADRDRAGHVGGAVQVLPTRIDEVERARLQRTIALRSHPVVDDGAVRTRARDGVEARAPVVLAACAHRRQLCNRVKLGDRAGRGAREPGQEAGERRTVPAMGGADAVELDRVLAGLGKRAGIRTANHLGPAVGQPVDHPDRRRRLVDQHRRVCACKAVEHVCQRLRLPDPNRVAEMCGDLRQELA